MKKKILLVMLFMLFLCPIEVEGSVEQPYYYNGAERFENGNGFYGNDQDYSSSSVGYVTPWKVQTNCHSWNKYTCNSAKVVGDDIKKATKLSANYVMSKINEYPNTEWIKYGYNAKVNYGFNDNSDLYAYHFKLPGYYNGECDPKTYSYDNETEKNPNCQDPSLCVGEPYELGCAIRDKTVEINDANGLSFIAFHMDLFKTNRGGASNVFTPFAPGASYQKEYTLDIEKFWGEECKKRGYDNYTISTNTYNGRGILDYDNENSQFQLFYSGINDTYSIKSFLSKYAIMGGTNLEFAGIGTSKYRIDIKSMKTLNGSIYGENIKSIPDGKNKNQRDYAYYLLWANKVTCTNDTKNEPNDCKVVSNGKKSYSESNVCQASGSTPITYKCKYDNGTSLDSYIDLKTGLKNETCYLTSDDGNKLIYSAEITGIEGSISKLYAQPVLSVSLVSNLKLKIKSGVNDTKIIERCKEKALKTIDSMFKSKDISTINSLWSKNRSSKYKKINISDDEKTTSNGYDVYPVYFDNNQSSNTVAQAEFSYNNTVCFNSNAVWNSISISCSNACEQKQGEVYLGQGKVDFNTDLQVFGKTLSISNCSFGKEIEQINLEYRPISLDNPFPGQNGGNSRNAGQNWSDENVVKRVITDRNIDTEYPMYIINLTSQDILEIRKTYSRNYSQDITNFTEDECELLSNSNSENISYKSGLITEYIKEGKITGRCVGKNREKLLCIDN